MTNWRQRHRRGEARAFSLAGVGISALIVAVIAFITGLATELPQAMRDATDARMLLRNDDPQVAARSGAPSSHIDANQQQPAETATTMVAENNAEPATAPVNLEANSAATVASTTMLATNQPTNEPQPENNPAAEDAPPFRELVNGLKLPPVTGGSHSPFVTLAKLNLPPKAQLVLTLLSQKATTGKAHLEIEKTADKSDGQTWTVKAVVESAKSKEADRTAVARFHYADQKLQFQWLTDANIEYAISLGNCALDILVDKLRCVTLLRPVELVPPVAIKLDKDSYSVLVREGIWNCERNELALDVVGIEGYTGYFRVYPDLGRVKVGDPIQVLFTAGGPAGTTMMVGGPSVQTCVQLTLVQRSGNLEVKVEPLVDVGGAKPVPFTKSRAQRIAKTAGAQYIGNDLSELATRLTDVAHGLQFRVMYVAEKGTEAEIYRAGSRNGYNSLGNSVTGQE